MSAHTPGPWRVSDLSPYTVVHGADGDTRVVANVVSPRRTGEAHCDARLIAAAPDLLAALKHRVETCGCSGDSDFASDRACEECLSDVALIARAEGR